MSKWQSKSENEINIAVTQLVHGCEQWGFNEENGVFYHCGIDGSDYHEQKVINYCGRPTSLWLHLLNNHIVVTPRMGSNPGDATGYREHSNPVIIKFDANDEALRAAAICLLEVNGVQPHE